PELGLLPIATVWAFIRYDLWGSRALLSRMLTRIAIGIGVCAASVAVATAFAVELEVPFRQALVAAGAGAVIAAALVALALTLADRIFFPARAAYKPSVAQLSAELTSITSPLEVARAIERTVERWLSTKSELAVLEPEPIKLGEQPAHRATEDGGVVLPVMFAMQRLGELRVGRKRGSALFTSEDMELLLTIADQGGLALAHAHAYQELEHRRREQAAAWRAERAALVETLSGEICHEVRDPLNFLRSVFDEENGSIEKSDLEVGRQELERLERLFRDLRRMSEKHLERRTIPVRELCERAERLLRDALGERALVLDLSDDAVIRCDADKTVQILINLMSNALEAAGADGEVGVRFARRGSAAEFEVWDTGPGFEGDPMSVFAPWYTTKERGTGLGLAITHRLVEAHDWRITPGRRDGRTVFTVAVRAADVPVSEARVA
ncbi:MAG TPA: HAMP domain-containing sensor histidine kinase, partial [Polyangiaceae bacterium]|nr:HAMP domain-containing sensor histidine kinase [Polyangiaceae bacterium]